MLVLPLGRLDKWPGAEGAADLSCSFDSKAHEEGAGQVMGWRQKCGQGEAFFGTLLFVLSSPID